MIGQLSSEFLPALIGVCAYVLFRLLFINLPPSTSRNKIETEPDFKENLESTCDPAKPQSSSGEQEPDQEPQPERDHVDEAIGTKAWLKWAFFACASMFIVVVGGQIFLWLDLHIVELNAAESSYNASFSQGLTPSNFHAGEVDTVIDPLVEEFVDVASSAHGEIPDHGFEENGGNALTIKLTRQKVTEDDQEDFVRSAYYGTLMIGSPPEPFTVVFDTGSGHLVLPSTYCKSETCRVHKRYRRSASATGRDINHNGKQVLAGDMRDQISVSFGTGEVTGVFVEDTVCMEHVSDTPDASSRQGDSIDNVELPMGCVTLRMIAATELSEEPFKDFQFDGILGLGLDGLSQTPEFNFLNVVAQSVRSWGGSHPQTFAVFLAEAVSESSEIALGGWSPEHLREDLSWNPVHAPEMGHWILNIKNIRANGELISFCSDGQCKAAVDTGTSLLAVPTDAFPELYELLKHPTPLSGHCQNKGPLLHIELDSFTVTLGPRDYARAEKTNLGRPKQRLPKTSRSPTAPAAPPQAARRDLRCNPQLMTLDLPEPLGPKLFILGEPVLRKYYTAYDAQQKRVGFARARHHNGPSREDLMVMAADEGIGARAPNMFDVFRWRKAYR